MMKDRFDTMSISTYMARLDDIDSRSKKGSSLGRNT